MGISFPIMNRNCTDGDGVCRSPSPEPALPDNSPTLPRSPADADSPNELANQLERIALSTPAPSAPVPIVLPSPVGSTFADFEAEGHRRASRPGTPCRSCGDRYLCPTCGLCGRCGREYAPSPEPEPTPEPSPEASNRSTDSAMWSMDSIGGVKPRRMLEVTVRGQDVANPSVVGPMLGRQFVLHANTADMSAFPKLRRFGDYFTGVRHSAKKGDHDADGMPPGAGYSFSGQTATFKFEIEDRFLTSGNAVGYGMAKWAQAALGGTWEHGTTLVQDGEGGGSVSTYR